MVEVSRQDRPHVFVGSSTEGLSVAKTLQVLLDYEFEVEIWNQGTFEPGGTTLESLVRSARTFDFAVLIVTPDDAIQSRGKTRNVTRDNVLFELGLFMGALGKERVYMLYDRINPPDLPSDLAGVTPVTYALHKNGNLQSSLGAASTQLAEVFNSLGLREAQRTEVELSHPSPSTADRGITGGDLDDVPLDLDVVPNAEVAGSGSTPDPEEASAAIPSVGPPSAAPVWPSVGSQPASQSAVAQSVDLHAVSDAEMEQAEELVRAKRRSYRSNSSFYRDLESGRWLDNLHLPPAFESAAARELLKQKWLREADLTRSWDQSNIVFMQLELLADRLTLGDIDALLELPTHDVNGHNQEAGLWPFLEFLEKRNSDLLSEKARQRLTEFRDR